MTANKSYFTNWFEIILLLSLSAANLTPATVDSASFIHIAVIFICVCIYNHNKYGLNITSYVLYILLWLEAIISVGLSNIIGYETTSITYLLFCILVMEMSNIKYSKQQLYTFEKLYQYLSILCSLLIILSWINGVQHGMNRYSIDIIGFKKNQNYVNDIIILSYAFMLIKGYKTSRFSLHNIVVCSILVFACFLTGTRAALLTLCLLTIIILYFIGKKKGKTKMMFLLLLLFFCGIYLLFTYAPAEISERFIGEGASEDVLRTMMWNANYEAFSKQPIWGLGINATNIINYKIIDEPFDGILCMHNVILQFIFEQGIVGLMILCIILSRIYLRFRKSDRFNFFMMFIALYAPIFFQNGLVGVTFWWPLVILEIYSKVSNKESLL